MAEIILRRLSMDTPWQTVDPFLFCVHHVDHYPRATAELSPAASLAGRTIGSDFSGGDGWSMYHGSEVPGFPQHPHRGFETVTVVRRGLIDHADSLGATARYGAGDVQWLTAGSGVVHAEMFPLLHQDEPNPVELFQIWLNLPRADKMADPWFTMLWAEQLPVVAAVDDGRRTTTITVVAGALGEARPPAPPPSSWAARPDADVAIWHLELEPGARWTLPPTASTTVRSLYVFGGDGLRLGDERLAAGAGAVIRSDEPVELINGDAPGAALVLQGRPIAEPVAQYGPFVLNDRAGIEQAFADYQRTGFGGWPWPADDPNHGPTAGRFARRADGTVETPPQHDRV